MGGLKLSGKRSSRTDIPQEIILEIMYRLPASSVGRFRSLSKEWRSLLSKPSFIKTHQVINTLNRNHLILVFEPIAASTASLSLLPFCENQHIENARPPKNYVLFTDDELDVIGCCNGLVLLSAFSVSDYDGAFFNHHLIVLNPTSKEFLELRSPNCCFDPDGPRINQFEEYLLYGFNYDSFTDDYKVVTIFNYNLYNVPVYNLTRLLPFLITTFIRLGGM
uniref:F-box/kelch-repeat protein At3g23880-like n=1 Tax=Erigeron canadensis TaxID=72917 RepID=UPI001CB88B08|nr:F-box/kelch-repeat protein At3g23880-like [Erigeron canadensis]